MKFAVIDTEYGAVVYGIFDNLEDAKKERDYANSVRHEEYQTVSIFQEITE